MSSMRDEAGTGPDIEEELDVPDLTGSNGAEVSNVWAEEEGGNVVSPASPIPPADVNGTGDEISELDSSSIGPNRHDGQTRILQGGQGSVSTPDDTPSQQQTPTPSVTERPRLNSPRGSLRPFDRRFQAKRTSSASSSILTQAQRGPGHLTPHSRTSSVSAVGLQQEREPDVIDAPWDVVRWTRLRRLTSEVFSEAAKRKFGRITCMAVASAVALGTSRGAALVFDSGQQLRCVIGEGTRVIESGSVTAIAISADYTTVATGHANGSIFTWEISKPAKPFLQIPPATLEEIQVAGKNGHISGVAILHLGFLGIRHTALVSADDKGMAFSHLATRGMGALGRTVKTTRILGRYPEADPEQSRPRKPSSVLAFSPLPMGTAEYCTDTVGLVAMLTPYLLVIVSTTPIAQTQHKIFRPKDITPHSPMSGAIAWYPAMLDESPTVTSKDQVSLPKLAFCWSNIVQMLEVSEILHEDEPRDGPPDLFFNVKATWRNEEPLVALQWLSRNILAGLTISQQLVILEDPPLRPTDSCDILRRRIHHVDLFSNHLGHMIEKLDDDTGNMHGVVADAFYMSFRSYKGRLFVLGSNDVAVGSLSNWADRILATMEHGDYIGSIKLASSYYAGNADVAAIGLPTSVEERHDVVGDKLLELMTASLKYAFGRNPDATDQRASEEQLEELVKICFDACDSLEDNDFLFDEVYSWFSKEQYRGMFFDSLKDRILEGKVVVLPPDVLKDLVNDFAGRGLHEMLEELICRLNPSTMDLDQITKLCKGHELFDALFYVWSQGIFDFTTILGDLLDALERGRISDESDAASKIFVYLSYTLTGRTYPSGEPMESIQATKAKAETYAFICLGSRPSADGSRTKQHRLRQLFILDTAALMSMLNEAFEDSFLIGSEDREDEEDLEPLSDEQRFGLTLNRQYVLEFLIEFVATSGISNQMVIFLDMFIARTVAKYPNDILLEDQIKDRVLVELCQLATEETSEDCQLSVEYLLSSYHPPDISTLIVEFHKARFFRVIKSIYRSEGQYENLLQTCLEDQENPDGIFQCLTDTLRPGSKLTSSQKTEFRVVVSKNMKAIVAADVPKAASTLDRCAPDLHESALQAIQDDEHSQYIYLREIMEPKSGSSEPVREKHTHFSTFNERYIQLLCDFDPHHVKSYVEMLDHGDLKLDSVLPALEASGMIDSAVILMAREGQLNRAIERLVEHLHTLGSALQSLLERADDAPDSANIAEAAEDLVGSISKYARVGIWLCNQRIKMGVNGTSVKETPKTTKNKQVEATKSRNRVVDVNLTQVETLWLELVDAVVTITRNSSEALEKISTLLHNSDVETSELLESLRGIVQSTFTGLLRATTASSPAPRFLPILRAFLARASKSSPSLTHLREALGAIFSAYAFEEGILGLANRLLDKDLFVGVEEVSERRQRGWRPLGLACGGCGKKLWGPGAGREIWELWYLQEQKKADEREAASQRSDQEPKSDQTKGKGKQTTSMSVGGSSASEPDGGQDGPDAVVVFACRHLFHRKCLNGLLGRPESTEDRKQRYTCPLETAQSD